MLENLKRRDNLEDLGTDGSLVLRFILKKLKGNVLTASVDHLEIHARFWLTGVAKCSRVG
jgi:hypothetical protein